MNDKEVIAELGDKLSGVEKRFSDELSKLRTGRAHPSMVEDVKVHVYETDMPMNQVATVTTPEAQLIQISPFDPNNIEAITTAIRADQMLGLNPVDDGHVIRIQIPPLTEERRKMIVKQLGEKQEEAMIGLRKARHDAMGAIDRAKKDKDISEDDAKRLQKQVDDAMNSAKSSVEATAKAKEADIMKV